MLGVGPTGAPKMNPAGTYRYPAPVVLTNRQLAHLHADNGVQVFPCRAKKERVFDLKANEEIERKEKFPHGFWQDSLIRDHAWIDAQWDKYPDAIPGMSLGAQRIHTMDLDGEEGIRQWSVLCALHEAEGGDLGGPRTNTPSGGTHIYYRVPEGVTLGNGLGNFTTKKLGGRIDCRGAGLGFVIAPGAEKADGEGYYPVGDDPLDFLQAPEMPPWLLAKLQAKPVAEVIERGAAQGEAAQQGG
jgi:hypothetical protein